MINNDKIIDPILGAINVIVGQRLSEVSFDKTVICTIVDDSKKDSGEYTVTEDNIVKFTAKAQGGNSKYWKNDQVYVTIPMGDMSSVGIIIGKYEKKQDSDGAVAVLNKYSKFIPVEENYISCENKSINSTSNGQSSTVSLGEKSFNLNSKDNNSDLPYTTFSLSAKFTTGITSAAIGEYGLKAVVSREGSSDIIYTLSNTIDMFGNTYNYEIPYLVQQVYPIDFDSNKITGIKILLYQDGNFKDFQKNSLKSFKIEVTDIKFDLGYNTQEEYSGTVKIFQDHTAQEVFSESDLNRSAHLVWYNYNSEKYLGFTDGEKNKEVAMKTYEADSEKPNKPNYWIMWYENLGNGSWQPCNRDLDFSERISLTCNNELAECQFKAILWINGEKKESNIISYRNVRSQDILTQALNGKIVIRNVEGGRALDSYTTYGSNNKLINAADAAITRTIDFGFEEYDENLFDENIILTGSQVYWYLPNVSTMLKPHRDWEQYRVNSTAEDPQGYIKYCAPYNIVKATYDFALSGKTPADLQGALTESYSISMSNLNKLYSNSGINWDIDSYFAPDDISQSNNKKIQLMNYIVYSEKDGVRTNEYLRSYITVKGTNISSGNPDNGFWISYRFRNTNEGKYRIKLNYKQHTNGSQKNEIYLIPSSQVTWSRAKDISPYEWSLEDAAERNKTLTEVLSSFKVAENINFNGEAELSVILSPLMEMKKDEEYVLVIRNTLEDKNDIKERNICLQSLQLLDPQPLRNFYYQISDLYNPAFTNNTIKCLFVDKNNYKYWGNKSIGFSSQGNSGTPYTLIIVDKGNNEYKGQLYNEKGELIQDNLDTKDIDNTNVSGSVIKETTATVKWNNDNDIILQTSLGIPYIDDKYYYQGPVDIFYDSHGINPSYYKGNLGLFNQENNIELTNLTWIIDYYSDDDNGDGAYGEIREDKNNNKYAFAAAPMYLSDGVKNRFMLVAKQGETVVCRYPIIIVQDRYSYGLLNNWDGSLKIDTEGNYIMSAMMGAGSKNSNNQFSGVLMGDIKKSDNTKEQGLFGYHQGAQSFGFKTDGTAFIGKSSGGRIYFNGNEGVIASASWYDENGRPKASSTDEGIVGTKLDLDDASLELRTSNGNYLEFNKNKNGKFKIKADDIQFTSGTVPDNWGLATKEYTNSQIQQSEEKITSTVNSGSIAWDVEPFETMYGKIRYFGTEDPTPSFKVYSSTVGQKTFYYLNTDTGQPFGAIYNTIYNSTTEEYESTIQGEWSAIGDPLNSVIKEASSKIEQTSEKIAMTVNSKGTTYDLQSIETYNKVYYGTTDNPANVSWTEKGIVLENNDIYIDEDSLKDGKTKYYKYINGSWSTENWVKTLQEEFNSSLTQTKDEIKGVVSSTVDKYDLESVLKGAYSPIELPAVSDAYEIKAIYYGLDPVEDNGVKYEEEKSLSNSGTYYVYISKQTGEFWWTTTTPNTTAKTLSDLKQEVHLRRCVYRWLMRGQGYTDEKIKELPASASSLLDATADINKRAALLDLRETEYKVYKQNPYKKADAATKAGIWEEYCDMSNYSLPVVSQTFESTISQKPDNISLSVTNPDNNTSSTIDMTINGITIASQEIKFSGLVSFENLDGTNPGKTVIDGSVIKTGIIQSQNGTGMSINLGTGEIKTNNFTLTAGSIGGANLLYYTGNETTEQAKDIYSWVDDEGVTHTDGNPYTTGWSDTSGWQKYEDDLYIFTFTTSGAYMQQSVYVEKQPLILSAFLLGSGSVTVNGVTKTFDCNDSFEYKSFQFDAPDSVGNIIVKFTAGNEVNLGTSTYMRIKKPKLEYGTVPTGWDTHPDEARIKFTVQSAQYTSAINQKADSISASVISKTGKGTGFGWNLTDSGFFIGTLDTNDEASSLNSSTSTFAFTSTGLKVKGNITATSLTIASGATVSGLSYNKLTDKPTASSFGITGDTANIIYTDDLSQTSTTSNGITTTKIKFKDKEYTAISNGDFVLTNIGLSGTQDGKSRYVCISKQGLLEATNAIISGTIYANEGEIGGCSISDGKLYVKDANISGKITATHLNIDNINAENVTISGTLTSGAGSSIGPMDVDSNSIYIGSWIANSKTDASKNTSPDVFISSGTSYPYIIGGQSQSGWAIGVNNKFGVDTTGALYCTKGSIGNGAFTVDDTKVSFGTWYVSTGTGLTSGEVTLGESGVYYKELSATWAEIINAAKKA